MSRQEYVNSLPRPRSAPEPESDGVISLERSCPALPGMLDERIRVLVADHDPISRHVLAGVLGRASEIDVVASADGHQPLRQWFLDRIDVAVLATSPREEPIPTIRELISRRIQVLLIGTGWTKSRLDGALAAGASAFLVKDTRLAGLITATRAVAAGHTVIAPELHGLYAAPSRTPAGPMFGAGFRPALEQLVHSLTSREREVLRILAEGMSTAEAAVRLKVSPATIKSHVSHALTKLGARNRVEAVLLMQRALLQSGGVDGPRPVGVS